MDGFSFISDEKTNQGYSVYGIPFSARKWDWLIVPTGTSGSYRFSLEVGKKDVVSVTEGCWDDAYNRLVQLREFLVTHREEIDASFKGLADRGSLFKAVKAATKRPGFCYKDLSGSLTYVSWDGCDIVVRSSSRGVDVFVKELSVTITCDLDNRGWMAHIDNPLNISAEKYLPDLWRLSAMVGQFGFSLPMDWESKILPAIVHGFVAAGVQQVALQKEGVYRCQVLTIGSWNEHLILCQSIDAENNLVWFTSLWWMYGESVIFDLRKGTSFLGPRVEPGRKRYVSAEARRCLKGIELESAFLTGAEWQKIASILNLQVRDTAPA